MSHHPRLLRLNLIIMLATLIFAPAHGATPAVTAHTPPFPVGSAPVCSQPPLTPPQTVPDLSTLNHRLYLPLILKGPTPPPCTVYCGLQWDVDPHRPAGYQTYFADEFDCNQLLDYWVVQPQMTAASYTPPAGGYVTVSNGTLQVGVPGRDTSFPYLYIVDDSATTYDIPHTLRRVDWLPNHGSFRVAMRVRFNVNALGEHRIAIYADGHHPTYAGPLFYIGTDYNAQQQAWRGLIVGADRGQNFVDMGDHGYPDPYTGWVVMTVDFDYSADTFTLAVDGVPVIQKPFSAFKGYPNAATRPDILYVGSLAQLEHASLWTDLEIDWLRVYAPATLPQATYGLLQATPKAAPIPTDPASAFSAMLPPGPFANTPHWSEDFADSNVIPDGWTLVKYPDPLNAWTELGDSCAKILNNGQATGVPVWAIFDDMLPIDILSTQQDERESPAEYLQRRGGWPFIPETGPVGSAAIYPRLDWRPNGGNIRYAWRGYHSANGYGVEISNGGHGDWGQSVYFTGAMFYTMLDTTTPGGGQFIMPGCQEQYFWRLHLLPEFSVRNTWITVTADYINGTVHLYANGRYIGWWPESDCSMNWYLKGENATSPEMLFFGNPATAPNAPGGWSNVYVDWFATFPGLPREPDL